MTKILIEKEFLNWKNKNYKKERSEPSDKEIILFLLNKAFKNNVLIDNEVFYRGQIIITYRELCDQFHTELNKIRRFIEKYTKIGLWKKEANRKHTILTLHNFDNK